MKQGFSSLKVDHSKKKIIKHQVKLKKEAENLRHEQARIEAKEKALETEKAKLLQMDNKELMVELIFAIRGFYAEFLELKTLHNEMAETLEDVENRLRDLEIDVDDLEATVNGNRDI